MTTKRRAILYVDDDTDDQFLVIETLSLLAPTAQVVVAGNGVETLAYLNSLEDKALPCLIIMDINMPLLNGKETVTRIRQQARFDAIPIVLFTTSASLLDKQFCDKHQVPFITKPVTGKDMQAVVEDMLLLAATYDS
ncbi:MAG TPA: response regulator [Flavisolibacter sp.]|nr:response regulator [Flavisolibacter sp.]